MERFIAANPDWRASLTRCGKCRRLLIVNPIIGAHGAWKPVCSDCAHPERFTRSRQVKV